MRRDALRDMTLLKTTTLKTTKAQLRAMPPATDLHETTAPHGQAGHNHHSHDHHSHDHIHDYRTHGHAKSGAHGHGSGVTPPETMIEARPAFRAGVSLVRMSMRARLAIALCAIVALWAIVLIAMM